MSADLSAKLQDIVGDSDGCPVVFAVGDNDFVLDGHFTLEQLQEIVMQVQASRARAR